MNPAARAAYQAAAEAIGRRKLVRDVSLRPPEYGAQLGEGPKAAIQQMAAAGWTAEFRELANHAGADVLAALHAAEAADDHARSEFATWSALAGRNRHANELAGAGLPAQFPDSDATMAAFNAIAPAIAAADQADDALTALLGEYLIS